MATPSHARAVKSLNKSPGLHGRRFVFKTFSQRIEEIEIDVYSSLNKIKSAPSEGSTFLRDCLIEFRELNTAEDFISFYEEMMPFVQTLPLVILHKETIFSQLLSRLQVKARLSVEAILRLIAALCRDLPDDFVSFLPRIVDSWVSLLKSGADREPDIIEQIFVTWSYILMYLQKSLLENNRLVDVLKLTVKLRYYPKEYVQEFMAATTSLLLRNASEGQLRKGIAKVILEVVKKPLPVKNYGASALLYFVMRGTMSRPYSRPDRVLLQLTSEKIFSIGDECDQGSNTVDEVLTTTLQRLCEELEPKELDFLWNSLYQKIDYYAINDHLPYLSRFLSLLISSAQINDGHKVSDYQPMLECVKNLFERFIIPYVALKGENHFSEVIDKVLQLLLCTLDGLKSCNDMATISHCLLQWAPAFKLRNSSILTFLSELMKRDPCILYEFRANILSAMNDLIETSQKEIVFLLLTFCEKLQMDPLRSNFLDGSPEGRYSRITGFLQQTVRFWLAVIDNIVNGNGSFTPIERGELTLLWQVVCCYPYVMDLQETPSLLMDLIDALDRLFIIEAENIAGFPKHTWQSLIGASLSSHYKCGKKFELEETSKVLRLAKTYKSSSQVLSAVADYLDHVHGSTLEVDTSHKTYHPEFEGKKAVDAFDVFADNLCNPDKGIRVPTLRILCHYEPQGCQMSAIDQPPEKKMKTEFSETCPEDSQSIDVLQLLLSIEATTLSISTSRKVVLLISRIQMGLSAGRIAEAYIPILLSGMIGIFHNRFSYQWASASECLAVLIGKHVALAWDKFVCYLEHCQSVFHMFNDKPGGSAELSDQSSDLAECSFVAPVSDSTPCATVLSSLLQTLQKIPSVAESRSRQIIPLFLKFLGYNNNDLASVGLFNPVTCKGKEWKGILKEWLNLLKLMRNSKAFYQNQFVKDVLQTRLIDEDDVHIQTSVLDCLLTWKDDFLLQYEQHLRNLISSNHLREELITWNLSRESAVIEGGHRANLVPLVILLLMPKVRKLKMLASRKHTSINQRKVVLRFIAQLDVGELTLFFMSLLKPLHILPEGVDSAAIFFWNLCKSSVDEFQTSDILKHFTMEKIMALSWKQRTGFLHVVEDILGVFDESRIRPFLDLLMGCVVRLLGSCTASLDAVKDASSVVEDNTSDNQKLHENNNVIINQVARSTTVKQFKDMRSLCLRIVSLVLNKYDDHDFGNEFWELFFKSVKPLIDSFKQEGSSSEKPSSLFSCFLAMSRSSHLVPLLFREKNLAPNIFSILTIPTATEAIISCVLKFIENLLNLEDDLDDEDNAAQKLLLLNLDELINSLHHLFQSDKATKRYPGEIQIRIFKFLSKYIKDQLPARQLVDILLSSLALRYKDSDVCIEYLQVVRDIIPVVGSESGSKILKAVSPLLTSVGLDVRLSICDLLDVLAKSDPSFLFVAKLLHELNATSATEMGGLDYDTVFKAYEKVGVGLFYTIPVDQALVILSHCVYDMSSVDITLRHSAYSSLLSFVEFSSAILCGEDQNQQVITNCEGCWTRASIQRTINKFLLKYMGNAMKARSSVRKEWIELLRDMVLKLPKVAKFSSFKALCSEDAEVDFFNNIIHLQKRMIARALLRFKTVISESTASEDILNKIFVPLFFNMLLEEQGGKGEHIKSACLEALASISALMEWKSYYNLLIRCFQEMNVHLDKQKILLRLICSILDQFHFSQICSSQEVKDPPDSSLADTSDSCSVAVSRKCVDGTSSAMVHKNGTSIGLSEILACLHKTVLPKIQKLLDSDSDKVNANISVAALKVLKLLPGDTIDSQLPSIIHRIANQLKSRMESIRDEARLALSACLKELGLEYLQFIVRVLRATLKRGYELHVLGYSLNFILSKFLSGPVCGKLDYCLQDLLSAVENDILGDVAEEKEVEKLASKMKETRKQKSFETLKMIAQNITFKTHALKLLSPVTTHMLKHQTPKVKPKLESMLNHIAAGIEHNPSADQTDLFIFIYGLIEDWIKEENGSLKNSSSAVAKLHSRGDVSQKTVSSGRVVGTKSVCSHLIAVFALRLFQNRIKRVKLDKNAEQLLSMLDPFVELLGNCLSSNYEDILSASLTCLTPLVRLPLPSLTSQADRIKVTLLDIAQSSVNTSSPLMQSCLRLLIALLWSTNVTLSSEQLHLLIEFPLFVDLERNPSFIALSLLKAIVNRKLVVPQMYDLAIRVAELMVTSQVESIRKKCSQILLKFLLHYRLSKKNLQQHLDFLLNNLSYEHSTGREAALEMLHAIIIKCGKINIEEFNSQEGSQKKFLDKHGQSLFIHLVQCLANDSDNKVRLMTGAVIKLLIRHISSDGFNSIMDFILSWYMDEKQNLQSLGAQTMGLPVEICLDMKEEVERMKEEVKGMKEEVKGMSDKIGVLTRKAEAMKKEIEDKSKRIEGMKEEVKSMEEEVEVLAKKDKVMKEDIEDKKKNVKDKSAKIEGVERKIEVTKKKIEVFKKSLEKYIHSALPVSKKILQSAVKVVASEPLLDHSDAAIPFWKEAYYSLVMLEKILNCFHDLCFERDLEDIWEAICELLLHPHTWLRNISSRLVAFYFASANKAIKQDHEKSLGMFFLMRPSRVFMIAVSLCCQLETEVIDDAMSNLITHNLATASFATHILMGRMECIDPCKFWSALDEREQGQFLEAFQLLDTRKGRGMLLHVISGVRRHNNVNQSDNLQYFLVSNLLKKMGDIALLKDAIQMKTVFNCFKEFVAHFSKEEKEFAAHINQDDCQHYAYDMLLSLYKVCEGFAGKVVPDNLKQLAQEVCDRIRKVIGMENFVQVYSNIRTNIKVRREKRKREGKVMAVTNPVRHAKRKLQVAAKNRAHKKRKIMTMKMKMGRWMR
ncbi:PREDICTED: U3 small nucleolar RNA-associated protein 20-like [Populus euphratica]|uniref:U3 small nucleolar RNA-associated protein 20-like n=1 Tax=Populus euphratica TaxID=75702 RepID=A0AAJ6VBX7_POPEU|nr:PREDICTED: U3 small nucleolar RNA-associated protein 20-like [Populus euphratica]